MHFSAGENIRELLTINPDIMMLAKQSGFYTTYSERGVVLYTRLESESLYFLHAIDSYDFFKVLQRAFADE